MSAEIIPFPGTDPVAEMPMSLRICSSVTEFVLLVANAGADEIEEARQHLLDASFALSREQLPLLKSRKKVDRREYKRLEVMRRLFSDASFVIRIEQERREL